MIAVVLAAGRGTRLEYTATHKALAPVAGVPVIDRILGALTDDGFDEIAVVTGHRADEVERHLAARPVGFARQAEPLGTADALLAARDAVGESPLLVTWADVLVEDGMYRRVAEAAGAADGAVAVNHLDDLSAGAAVAIEAGMVTAVTEKPGPNAGWNLTGILALDDGVWPHVEAVERSIRGEYELPDAIDAWVGTGGRVVAVPTHSPAFETGTAAGLAAASAHYSGDTLSR